MKPLFILPFLAALWSYVSGSCSRHESADADLDSDSDDNIEVITSRPETDGNVEITEDYSLKETESGNESESDAKVSGERSILSPESEFNSMLSGYAWRCLGTSWNGYYQTMKEEDAEYVVAFRPVNELSGQASFVKWKDHNKHKSYAEIPSQDDYHYMIKGDIIELKNDYPEVEMSFKISRQNGRIVLRSLDYVENGVFEPVTKSANLFP